MPHLQPIHSRASLRPSSVDFWRHQTTQTIVASLAPGAIEPLTVTDLGAILDGNTRVYELMDRGY